MRRKSSLRFRFTLSYFLILVPIFIFSIIIYVSNQSSSRQHIDASTLQNFNYAAENISTIFSQLDYAAQTAFNVESALSLGENGEVSVASDGAICAALGTLEERILPQVSALFYIKSDHDVFTSEGKLLYSDYEYQYQAGYDLSSSTLFTRLQTVADPTAVPLLSAQDGPVVKGLAYLLPFPTNVNSRGVLAFILSNEAIAAEFENYMGDLPGNIYIYDGAYRLLYASGGEEYLSTAHAMKLRGTGVLSTTAENGEKLVALRVSMREHNLNLVMLVPYNDFYASSIASQRLLVILMLLLFGLLLFLMATTIFFNYKPIQDLVTHIAGRNPTSHFENELDVIRSRYDQTVDEAKGLSTYLNEITPLVTQQFVRRLIFGYIFDEKELASISSRADIHFTRRWSFAMYLSFFRQEADTVIEQAIVAASLFLPVDASAAVGELTAESALCILINFDADPEKVVPATEAYAQQLYTHMAEHGASPEVIGIGAPYEMLLKMNESFVEASAAVHLAPASHAIWRYRESLDPPENNRLFQGLSPTSLYLLGEGINRGDKITALRAFHSMVEDISSETTSLFFFRFYCSDLLAAILRQAEGMNLYLPKERVHLLLSFNSQAEFIEQTGAFLEELCAMVKERISQEDEQRKKELFDYILSHFKDTDLSIQAVADALGIRRVQISSLMKEETGQGFAQYISYLRMNEFKRLLCSCDDTIQNLVNRVGYSDAPNFLRKFKTMEGITPGQYRQMHKQKTQ